MRRASRDGQPGRAEGHVLEVDDVEGVGEGSGEGFGGEEVEGLVVGVGGW